MEVPEIIEQNKIYIEQKKIYRTASESARTLDPEEYEDMVFYRTFVLLISFYNFGTTCTPQNRVQNYGEIIKPRGK